MPPIDAPKSPEVTARDYATRLNDSVNRNDSKLYQETMQGISDWTKNNDSSLHGKFNEALIGQVDLKTAALYDTKENFKKIDISGNGKLDEKELAAYGARPELNDLQKRMNEEVAKDQKGIANNSKDRWFNSIFDDKHIRPIDLQVGLEKQAAAKPKPELTDKQVQEKVDSPEMLAESADHVQDHFTEIDTNKSKTLSNDELTKYAADPARTPMEKAYIEKGILPNAAEIGKGDGKADISRADLDKTLESEYAKPEVKAALNPEPTSQLVKLATVQRGEGPYHSAERIFKASGVKADYPEVRALSDAMAAVFKADGGDLRDLHVRHNFITKENFKRVLDNVQNEKAREALKKMIAA